MNAMFINGNPMKAISPLLLIATLIFPVPAMLATFEDGWDLMYQGDFDKAYKIFFELSESGDPYGTFGLGVMYQFGNGVEKDEKKAMEYYVEAANEDVVEAMHNIGYLYQHGKGVDVDLKEAIKWYGKAANLGYGVSQNDLAYLYEHGIGTPIDLDKAFDLYKKAAEQRIPGALDTVGIFYFYGKSVDVDYFLSYAYMSAAAKLGSEAAESDLKWPRGKLSRKESTAADELANELAGF